MDWTREWRLTIGLGSTSSKLLQYYVPWYRIFLSQIGALLQRSFPRLWRNCHQFNTGCCWTTASRWRIVSAFGISAKILRGALRFWGSATLELFCSFIDGRLCSKVRIISYSWNSLDFLSVVPRSLWKKGRLLGEVIRPYFHNGIPPFEWRSCTREMVKVLLTHKKFADNGSSIKCSQIIICSVWWLLVSTFELIVIVREGIWSSASVAGQWQ